MLITVYTDIHFGATNQWDMKLEELCFGPGYYYIGDIIDMANCKKSEVHKWASIYQFLKNKAGANWIDGNHSRMNKFPEYMEVGNAVLAHGDFESWGREKAVDYRSKPHGASFFKRGIIVNAIELAEKLINRPQSPEFLERAYQIAKKYDKEQYVCGHMHPQNIVSIDYKDVRITVLPRGKSIIEV